MASTSGNHVRRKKIRRIEAGSLRRTHRCVAGLFISLAGVIFGPFIGAGIGELSAQRGFQQVAQAGIGATVGLVLGAALKIAMALTMIGRFVVVRFV